ncbi:TetR/AcrR family transcriptional regulator [Flammeovirgaceae bacterium SG7u.111]|nr:TetR/AcrR family transcriptional regulator [Flammeovirgaceae bacterium SG7u.132]WPO37057.1 TetR/AcrR family transcriptional regulator [Flammeovirgaceae bacterium SG7u.111]
MSEMREQILDLAEVLIRSKGYNAFSYKDISTPLEVKNAAIHYHFPTKADLGKAIIDRTMEKFAVEKVNWSVLPPLKQLEAFIGIYDKSYASKLACFMGAMGSAYETFPPKMQESLTAASQEIRVWLREVFENGRKLGNFNFKGEASDKADEVVSALLSSLILSRVTKENVLATVKRSILENI